jgi:hypothetical protein
MKRVYMVYTAFVNDNNRTKQYEKHDNHISTTYK